MSAKMPAGYKGIKVPGTAEIEVKGSRFIGHAAYAGCEDEALEVVDGIRREHQTASHNAYAYKAGLSPEVQKASDDGEPSGTAGVPILEVIKQRDLCNVVVVVTRYFGGTLLGAAGLLRAYSAAASKALDAAQLCEWRLHQVVIARFAYTHLGRIENTLRSGPAVLSDIEYGAEVEATLLVLPSDFVSLRQEILDISGGTARFEVVGERYAPSSPDTP